MRPKLEKSVTVRELARLAGLAAFLFADLSPEVCRENAGKYGWLTCEDDPRVVAWFTARTLEVLRKWREDGRLDERSRLSMVQELMNGIGAEGEGLR